MRKRWQIIMIFFLLLPGVAESQEVITGLLSNKKLVDPPAYAMLKSTKGTDTLPLPFFDDFSYSSPYPASGIWGDRFVFINNTFSVRQISQGVATFDCLDDKGKLYEEASTGQFEADRLTSKPIDLDVADDSVFLSFFYEAGGIADLPERSDSITLSFWAPEEERWYSVWRAEGEASDGFRRVMIPVKSARYLKNGFRFRFLNYASLSGAVSEPSRAGNADQWNIDFVKIDTGRTENDTVFRDIAITLPQRSLLKNYEAMPWNQFRQAYLSVMSPTLTIMLRNNDTLLRQATRQVNIFDVFRNTEALNLAGDAQNISPLKDTLSTVTLLYTFASAAADSALFRITTSLKTTQDWDYKGNDTLVYYQRFTDYFAIDDGTAEAGYGINGQGARNAMGAIRFRSFLPDSVSAIRICFNDAYENANQRAFDIMVWSDNNGIPGALLASSTGSVAAPATDNNGFTTYYFDTPVKVNGNFWVGWKQDSETFLNIGLDLNTGPAGRQYYWINGAWFESQASGTVMVRAVMTGTSSGTSSDNNNLFNDLFRIYPNPATDEITLEPSDRAPSDYIIDFYSSGGTRVLSLPRTERPDISSLAAGYYIVVIRSVSGVPVSVLRLIKRD